MPRTPRRSTLTPHETFRWSHMCRVLAAFGLMSDFDKTEVLRARATYLGPLLRSGRVIQLDRGLYRLADDWQDRRFPGLPTVNVRTRRTNVRIAAPESRR